MRLVLSTLTAAALAATSLVPVAQAAPVGDQTAVRQSATNLMGVEKTQFLFGGRNYCWYDSAWQGPGFYWCGYAWRGGYGWGGAYGWNGWGGGHPGGYSWGGGQTGHRGHSSYSHSSHTRHSSSHFSSRSSSGNQGVSHHR